MLWLLDAALQLQPKMFGQGFVSMMTPMAQGQPAPIAHSISAMWQFLQPHVALWNLLFAAVQAAIGYGLIVSRRTVRPTLVVSFVWCLLVWWFGEGFGALLTGSASPLTGSPGSVLLYGLAGVVLWPTQDHRDRDDIGVASSVAAAGPLRTKGALGLWAALWVLPAVLWLQSGNRAPTSVHDAMLGASSGEPGWYSHLLAHVATLFSSAGTETAFLAAAASLLIGFGPIFFSRRPAPFLILGTAVSVLYWVTGQALGGTLTGMGTDPNTAPLVVLLAIALLPTVRTVRSSTVAPQLAAGPM